ncbi:MAG: thiamine-monophosphate kinase [Phycisphaerae bacterium]|nr:thiamine-monophosphate kinase [Phycisphaerae bacterium]
MREFAALEAIFRHNGRLPSFVTIPPGDDMAEVTLGVGPHAPRLLVAADQVIEGRHVRRGEDLAIMARKAVARNVSDVAAMAARPFATVATVVLRSTCTDHEAREMLEGLRASADVFGCPLVSGDLATHADPAAPIVVSVTILARPAHASGRVVTRRGSREGDGIYVTGTIGGSLDADGRGRHLTFAPRVSEAHELHELLGSSLHAMIDVSDGLGQDAAHLAGNAESGDTTFVLAFDRIPITPGRDPSKALGDGEDYELLFTADREPPSRLSNGTPVTRIGRVDRRGADGLLVALETPDAVVDIARLGWEYGR